MIIEEIKNVSITKFGKAIGLSASAISRAMNMPIPGEVYDPNAINYVELEKLFAKRNISLEKLNANDFLPEHRVSSREEIAVGKICKFKTYKDEKGNYLECRVVYVTKTHVAVEEIETGVLHAMINTSFYNMTVKE